jgi:CheY-like chemotaxis protein
MNVLIVKDSFISRLLLQETLKNHGWLHMAVNGEEAVEADKKASNELSKTNVLHSSSNPLKKPSFWLSPGSSDLIA